MIVVGVNGKNQFGGSFYANSPVTGNWEDFLTKDVVNYIDSKYRTLEGPENRGITGFSMGGSGAVNVALSHPDKFGHLYTLSPGLFDEKGLDVATEQWVSNGWRWFLDGYAATFAPFTDATNGQYWHPWSADDQSVRDMWSKGYGDIEEKVQHYKKGPHKLANIHLEYGNQDQFYWIVDGTKYMSDTLTKNGIKHTIHDHGGGHVISKEQGLSMIAFFSDSF